MPYYMKLADEHGLLLVRGDVRPKGYEGWISLTSAQVNAARVAVSAGPGSAAHRGSSSTSIIVTKLTATTTARLFHLGSSVPTIICTIVFIADCATIPHMTVEISRASLLMSSGTAQGDQIEIVGDIRVQQKSAPPPTPRESWNDFSRPYG